MCIIYVNLTQIYKELEKGQNKKPFFSFFKIAGRTGYARKRPCPIKDMASASIRLRISYIFLS